MHLMTPILKLKQRFEKSLGPALDRPHGYVLNRTTADILKIAFFAAALATLNNLVMHDGLVLAKLKLSILAFLCIFVMSASLMLVFSIILRRRTRSTTLLQQNVVRPLCQALDQSWLNPHPVNKNDEHLTRKTSSET